MRKVKLGDHGPYSYTAAMGHDEIILWLSPELARGYFIAVVIGVMGLLQIVAVESDRGDLRWLPERVARPAGVMLAAGAVTGFYLFFYPLIFVPGPAGTELMLLFGGGCVVAVWLTRVFRQLVLHLFPRKSEQRGNSYW